MPINETILKNRKYRHCIDSTPGNKRWNRYSFWTHASDVEFNDGRNLQDKLGSFKGVTTNENQTAGYAADVTLVKSMKNSLSQLITSLTNLVNSINERLGGLRFYEDSNGVYIVGADSVPKKLGHTELAQIKITVGAWSDNAQYDIKPFTNDWSKLTNDNFLTSGASFNASGGQGILNSTSSGIGWNYNANTGILSCHKSYGGDGGLSTSLSCTIYLIVAF